MALFHDSVLCDVDRQVTAIPWFRAPRLREPLQAWLRALTKLLTKFDDLINDPALLWRWAFLASWTQLVRVHAVSLLYVCVCPTIVQW